MLQYHHSLVGSARAYLFWDKLWLTLAWMHSVCRNSALPSPPISTLLLHVCARAGHRCSSCPHLEHKPTTSQRIGQGEDNSYGPFSASRELSTCSFKVCFTQHARNSGSSFWGGVAPHHSQNRHNLNTYGW